jgi:hypothetical protein
MINSRPPTGKVPWPLILLEGEEKSGRSWACAVLSKSEKVGQTYWIDLGEGAADEYGAIPGTRYQVIIHDGEWAKIVQQVGEVKAEAERAAKAGEPPVVLVIDSATALWDLLKSWASERAGKAEFNRKKLAADPNAEVTVSMNLWNDAGARYRKLMTQLLTFPGIVVVTARGKRVAKIGDNGKPVEGQKDYSVEGHKTLAYDATVWVRMARDASPQIIGCRSVHAGIKPGSDKAKTVPQRDDLLEWLIFDVLKVEPASAHTRDLPSMSGDKPTADEVDPLEERKQISADIRKAAAAIGIDSAGIGTDYLRRNNVPISEASIDDLNAFYADLVDEFKARGEQEPGHLAEAS